jgi:hypothetical protein
MATQLLLAALAGLVLGVIAVLLGVAELRHRTRLRQAEEDTVEFPPVLAAPRPVRGRWS